MALFGCRAVAVPAADAPEAARVVIVANSADPDSESLAAYYARARGIPPENIVPLFLPREETVPWPVFAADLFNPLSAELIRRGWISAVPSAGVDACGRREGVFDGHRISYLVLMRGVPLRIAENPAWLPAGKKTAGINVNCASVDGELALLARSGSPVYGMVPNPLYRQVSPSVLVAETLLRVARLDGPTPESVRSLVDSAVEGERRGPVGRAYLDLGGPHAEGNGWLEAVASKLARAGFDLSVDREKTTIPPLGRFEAPVLYFGWYAWNVDGPFKAPGFRFPAGAVAVHIHSFSAESLRNDSKFWCAPLVARGVAATLGNVHEPYLGATHHLDLFADALLRGETFGTAAYYALPGLSWQAVAIGDPLYRPFARSLDEQWAAREALPKALRPWLVLRRARAMHAAGQSAAALSLARGEFRETPSVALGVSLAWLVREVEGDEAAVRALAFLDLLPGYTPDTLGAVAEAADLLVACRAWERALALYEKALGVPVTYGEAELLEKAIRTASRAGLPQRAEKWQARLLVLKPPPPPKPEKK